MGMTLAELKRRHDTGDKLYKNTKKKIEEQLKRKCGNPECGTSLAFRRTSGFCSKKCSARKRAIVRTKNRQKKKAYYERHGIKFDKTVRNRKLEDPGVSGVRFEGQTLLYENYKQPLKAIPKSKGYGYYGTVALTDDREYVQCHLCGHLFPSVGAHLRKHKITARKYKEMFELDISTALVSEPVREKRQEIAVKTNAAKTKGLPEWLKDYNEKVQTGVIKHKGAKRTGMSLERRNKAGVCPDQVLDKIRILAEELGHTPSADEFREHYKGKYAGSIAFQHGSYLKAVAKLGLKSAKEEKEYTTEELLNALVEFKEQHGRIPMSSDFNRGLLPARNTYFHRFGTLNNARVEAGLNAILPMGFGKMVEMTPDEYMEYKVNREKSKEAVT
jgi:hypothetical protein